jgi:Sulfotransferase family
VADHSEEAGLIPILVDGSGRDGTTLAMQLLATAPEIAFDRVYPYEQRYFNYLLQWSRLPEQGRWDESKWGLDNLAHADSLKNAHMLGPVPWLQRSLIAGDGSEDFAEAIFEAVWSEFSRRAREAMRAEFGDQTLVVRYYAQKNAETWEIDTNGVPLPQLNVIALLRDPRDVWQSSVAFHRRRKEEGGAFLPIADGESEDSYLGEFIEQQKTRLAWLQAYAAQGEMPIVRYESLITDLPAEAKRIGEWLGVHLDAGAVVKRREGFGKHITADSPEASVERWKSEMSEALAARFAAAMGTELAELGYEV